jgi:hypothetical protein
VSRARHRARRTCRADFHCRNTCRTRAKSEKRDGVESRKRERERERERERKRKKRIYQENGKARNSEKRIDLRSLRLSVREIDRKIRRGSITVKLCKTNKSREHGIRRGNDRPRPEMSPRIRPSHRRQFGRPFKPLTPIYLIADILNRRGSARASPSVFSLSLSLSLSILAKIRRHICRKRGERMQGGSPRGPARRQAARARERARWRRSYGCIPELCKAPTERQVINDALCTA